MTAVTFNEDNSLIIRYNFIVLLIISKNPKSGSNDCTLRFWDLKSNNLNAIEVCKNFKDSVSKIIVRGTNIFTSSLDGFIIFIFYFKYNFKILATWGPSTSGWEKSLTITSKARSKISTSQMTKSTEFFIQIIIITLIVYWKFKIRCFAVSCMDSKIRLFDRIQGEKLSDFTGRLLLQAEYLLKIGHKA